MQLFKISEMPGQQILKIVRVLGPRWAACSLRSALAVWRAYPALYKYFSSEAKHSGMAARLCNRYFLENLALMIGIRQEISLLSDAFQVRNLTLTKAEQLVKRTIKAFEMLKESKGTYEKKSVILLLQNLLRIFILLKITKSLAFLVKSYLKQ